MQQEMMLIKHRDKNSGKELSTIVPFTKENVRQYTFILGEANVIEMTKVQSQEKIEAPRTERKIDAQRREDGAIVLTQGQLDELIAKAAQKALEGVKTTEEKKPGRPKKSEQV